MLDQKICLSLSQRIGYTPMTNAGSMGGMRTTAIPRTAVSIRSLSGALDNKSPVIRDAKDH